MDVQVRAEELAAGAREQFRLFQSRLPAFDPHELDEDRELMTAVEAARARNFVQYSDILAISKNVTVDVDALRDGVARLESQPSAQRGWMKDSVAQIKRTIDARESGDARTLDVGLTDGEQQLDAYRAWVEDCEELFAAVARHINSEQ